MEYRNHSVLVKKLANINVPLSVQIALTYSCNLNCIHCFESKDTNGELGTQEIKDILLQLQEMGCITVTFTGGEVFLRQDALEIFDFLHKRGFGIYIMTNGTLLTRKLVKHIKKINPLLVHLSLYGVTSKVHDSITRCKGSFEKTLNAISLLKAYNIRFNIGTMVMLQNFHELKALREMARRKKWNLITDYVITPRHDGSKAPFRCRISQEQIRQTVAQLKLEGNYLNNRLDERRDGYFYSLYLCHRTCYISAQGEVFPSCSFRMNLGKLRESSFKKIWINSEKIKSLRKLKLDDFSCSSCRHSVYCCWDPGLAWLEHGDFRVPAKEICRLMNAGLRRDGKLILKD